MSVERLCPEFGKEKLKRTLEIEFGLACLASSDRILDRFLRSFQKGEVQLLYDHIERQFYRFNRVASIDVFYTAKDGRRYRLEEAHRFTLRQSTIPEDYFIDPQIVVKDAKRTTRFSVTELMGLSKADYLEEAVRGVMEEVFDFAMSDWSEKERVAARDWIRHKISSTLPRFEEVRVSADSSENSFPGIKSVQENYICELHLQHKDGLVEEDENGVPTDQIEFISDKGYLNISTWRHVTE